MKNITPEDIDKLMKKFSNIAYSPKQKDFTLECKALLIKSFEFASLTALLADRYEIDQDHVKTIWLSGFIVGRLIEGEEKE